MLTILKRPPNDLFTFRLFYQLSNKIKAPADKIYTWSPLYETVYCGYWNEHNEWIQDSEFQRRQELLGLIHHNIVVLGVKDHLTTGDFNPWLEEKPKMVKYFNDMFKTYSDKQFVFFTSLENLDQYIKEPNVVIIPWGGDITNQKFEYSKLEPVLDKNLNSKFNYVSLNRNKRSHRAFLVSLLYAENFDHSGLISCMFKDEIDDVKNYLNWPLDIATGHIVNMGFDLLKSSSTLLSDSKEIYVKSSNDNVTNFNEKLRQYYQQTFLEIITETSCTEKCFNLTEKTLNSIYGCNFPILISSAGSVKFLRDMGLDLFDDIVDHSYDSIENPIDRIKQALYNNKHLLTDNEYIKSIWIKSRDRFLSNINFAKSEMYNYYYNRAQQRIEKYINDCKL